MKKFPLLLSLTLLLVTACSVSDAQELQDVDNYLSSYNKEYQKLLLNAVILSQKDECKDSAMNNFEDLCLLLDAPIFLISKNEIVKHDSDKSKMILKTILGQI